jgi:hypothetical protein
MSGVEAVGAVVEGALAARAIEPDHGEATDGHSEEKCCLNCGTPLLGRHCHACGQAAHVHMTLGAFFHDLLHGVFHFEGKIWRTIPALVFRPGRMAREYIDGKRATYVSPIALFLFCVFLMFAVVKTFAPDLTSNSDVEVNGHHIKGLEANKAELARLEKQRAQLVAQGEPTDAIDGVINGRKIGIAEIEKLADPATAALSPRENGRPRVYSDIPAVDRAIRSASKNPQLAIYRLQSDAYKFAWLLIPLSVPFVWLLFAWKRRFGLYDHTVFVTYSLCFMMLLVSALSLGSAAGIPLLLLGMVLFAPLHLYKQVRHAYDLSRWGALWRTGALLTYALFALIFFLILLLAMASGG